ncbi:MAG: putative Ig domain-containing protein [Anaerohalosphaera sp.]|nr:putative Ig domain-containing protein [Anaerohalosphaera sp.]
MRTIVILAIISVCLAGCGQVAVDQQGDEAVVVSPLAPVISAPSVVGVYPGTPFLHTVGTTGAGSVSFSAVNLPDGLVIDSESGMITGVIDEAGEYTATVTATSFYGSTSSDLTIVVGDTLALTPPMGWMTWNMFAGNISEQLIMEIADAMVATGMRDAGYSYIVIDDLWQGKRNANGYIGPDPKKFPNGIKVLADYVHSKGLKLGIYSDAAPRTCAGALGSLGYEDKDADTYADWGVDYLKYDYCGAPGDQETAIKRYTVMADALKATDRSIMFAACEWGPRKPWLWAADAGANVWRTTWDIRDTWDHGQFDSGHNGIINCLDRHIGLEQYVGPGRWNDPDMIIAGLNGKGGPSNANGAKGCTDIEYRSQMSLWALLAAPLITSFDVRNADEATLEILLNTEVIEIDQDPLGIAASRIVKDGELETWARPLADGSKAVGLLNRDDKPRQMTVTWNQLNIEGNHTVRNVWTQKSEGVFETGFTTQVPSHGVVLVKISEK